MVSSGAVGAGYARLNLPEYPKTLEDKQACAAVGQGQLVKIYDSFFSVYGHTVAQILMTKDVVDSPERLEHIKNTFFTLLRMGCVPVVNENDSVSCEGIEFGGNDTLSAYVAIACEADLIINLSDIDGLYDKDPRKFNDAKLIDRVEKIDDTIRSYAGGVALYYEYCDIDFIDSLDQGDNVALLDADKLKFPLRLRRWQDGDWFVPFGMSGRKKLSDFLIDKKVSLAEKRRQFVLMSGDDIVWVVGRRLDDRYAITRKTENVLKVVRDTL
jgi:tRNA(Ile)-lysidine synthetase-like protein